MALPSTTFGQGSNIGASQQYPEMSQRIGSTQRIISPTSSCNNYPHLRAENSVFGSVNASKRQTGYGAAGVSQTVFPQSYGTQPVGGARSQSKTGQEAATQRTNIVQSSPAQYKSVLSIGSAGTSKPGPAYGTTNDNGEVISVKGHLQDLESKLSDILTEIKYHRQQVTIVRGEKETLETVLTMKINDTKKSVQNDEARLRADMERCRKGQRNETNRLQQQVRTLNLETNTIGQKLLALQRRVHEMESNMGIE